MILSRHFVLYVHAVQDFMYNILIINLTIRICLL